MVEERRLSKLFMNEATYFLERGKPYAYTSNANVNPNPSPSPDPKP